MNSWEIKSIEIKEKKVVVLFKTAGHELMHSFFVEEIHNPQQILQGCRDHYAKYLADLAQSPANAASLPAEILALIGQVNEHQS